MIHQIDAQALTAQLGGRWRGRYGSAACPNCQPERRPDQAALTIANGAGGRLLAHCFKTGCGFVDIIAAAGVAPGAFTPDPAEVARRAAAERAEREKRTAQARAIWTEAVPIDGSLGERYLRRRAVMGPLPQSLRFHPRAWHTSAKRFPAMIAAVVDLRGELVACHRTYLTEPGTKAPIDPARAMLGPVAGAAVRLSEGTGPVVIGEGVETTLSLRDGLAHLDPRAWAALSAAGVAALELPKPAGELVIAPDPDPTGRKAAEALAQRAWAAGWRVKVLEPPAAGDWNDAALAGFATLAGPEARISEAGR